MLTLDLFKSPYEQALSEGRVDEVPQTGDDDGPPIPSNLHQFSTPDNWGVVSGKWAEIQDAVRLNVPYVTLNWPTGGTATLTRNQLWTIYQRAVKMSRPKRTSWGLTTLNDAKNLMYWIANTKIINRPEVKRPVADPAQGELPLDDLKEKKSSETSVDSPYKDVRVQRAIKQAAFNNPAAASPEEAFIKSMLDAQDKDQEDIAKLRQSTQQQRDLLSKNIKKDNEQEELIGNISSEIQKVDRENDSLQKMQQRMIAANARLQKTLDAMKGKKAEPAPASNVGVSVATDKVPEPTVAAEPAPTSDESSQIQKLRSTIARLTKQMKNRLDQGQNDELVTQLRSEIGSLKDQLAQVTNQPPQQLDLELPSPNQQPKAKKAPMKYKRVNAPKAPAVPSGLDIEPLDIGPAPTAVHEDDIAEALPAKAAKELYRWKNQQNQPHTEPTVTSVEPQPIPARLSDLQSKHQKVANLADIKKTIEALQARATRGGRMLPRGLAADLEDYFTTTDIDTAYDDMMAKYQKQLGALQQYLGMRKVLWSPKKDVHEMRAKELNESGMETWTVHFTDGTAVRVRVSDETDPAMVRKHYANKGKTVAKFDYGYGVEPDAGPGPEAHEPGSGRAVSGRTGDPLPEDTMSEFKAAALAKIKKALANPKLDPATRRDYEARIHKLQALEEGRAGFNPLRNKEDWLDVQDHLTRLLNNPMMSVQDKEVIRQRYLEKKREAEQKGFTK